MRRLRVVLALLLLISAACSARAVPHQQPSAGTASASPAAQALMGGAGAALAPTPAQLPLAPASLIPAAPAESAATAAVRSSPAVQAALDALTPRLDADRQRRGIAGMSVAVVYDQSMIWSAGFGAANVETQAPATPQTLYRVGSITKLFTDTMLMQLRDQGKLRLDDPVQRYLPEFTIPDRYSDAAPTFRELASHTGGLPREAPLNYWRTRAFPFEAELLASLPNAQMIGAPGRVYQYSNLGVAIEGIALERVAGEPYAQYVRDHILTPLGMSDSGFDLSAAVKARLAVGSSAASSSASVERLPDFGALTPAAGLNTSVEDISRFISLQFRDGDGDTGPVLSGPTLQEMHAGASRGSAPGDFAIGWELGSVAGRASIGHPGVVYGFNTQITLVPDTKLGVAVFTNARTDPAALCNEILASLLPAVQEAAGR